MKVSIADALETITIDLWGVDYENQYVTKSTAKPAATNDSMQAEGRTILTGQPTIVIARTITL